MIRSLLRTYRTLIMSSQEPLSKKLRVSGSATELVAPPINKEVVPAVQVDYKFNKLSAGDPCYDGSIIKFRKRVEHAIVPARGSQHAAGFDLFSSEEKVIAAGSHGLVKTGISVELPAGSYGRIAPRSGLAVKKFIDIGAGVVDVDYRGDVGVVIFNHFHEDFTVQYGDKIAQLVVERIFMPSVEVVQELSETVRGASGYGSTGASAISSVQDADTTEDAPNH